MIDPAFVADSSALLHGSLVASAAVAVYGEPPKKAVVSRLMVELLLFPLPLCVHGYPPSSRVWTHRHLIWRLLNEAQIEPFSLDLPVSFDCVPTLPDIRSHIINVWKW